MNLSPQAHLIHVSQAMSASGLNKGTAGNLSLRGEWEGIEGFWITPTGMDYTELTPADIPFVRLDSAEQNTGQDWPLPTSASRRQASSEWRLHLDIYRTKAAAASVLHAHSPFATALACLHRDIPAFHYMIARFGGNTVRCAPYALFGTQALSDAAILALHERSACLLANHGMVVYAGSLNAALASAIELENLCEQFWRASQLGSPVILDEQQMDAVMLRFANYGKQPT